MVRGATGRSGGRHRRRSGPLLPGALCRARGWLGMRLDRDVDWDEVASLCEEAFRIVVPARLIARLAGQT